MGDEIVPEEKPKGRGLVDEAKEVLAKIEAANKLSAEMIQQQEELRVESILSGQADAGQAPVKVDKNQQVKDEVNRMLRGTGRQI